MEPFAVLAPQEREPAFPVDGAEEDVGPTDVRKRHAHPYEVEVGGRVVSVDDASRRGDGPSREPALALERRRETAEVGAPDRNSAEQLVAASQADVASGADPPDAPTAEVAQQDEVTLAAAVVDDVGPPSAVALIVRALHEPAALARRELDSPRRVGVVQVRHAWIQQQAGASDPRG